MRDGYSVLEPYPGEPMRSYDARVRVFNRDERRRNRSERGADDPRGGRFEGKEIKVIQGAYGRPGRFEFFYGGTAYADGPGHGHVICNDGETISFWRLPVSEGVGRNGKGRVVVDDKYGVMFGDDNLDSHWSD